MRQDPQEKEILKMKKVKVLNTVTSTYPLISIRELNPDSISTFTP